MTRLDLGFDDTLYSYRLKPYEGYSNYTMNDFIQIERILPRNDNGWESMCYKCGRKFVEECGGVKIHWRLLLPSCVWQNHCINCFNELIIIYNKTFQCLIDKREAILNE